ncbi:MAG: hypothetical protein DRJ37_02715, partial [Thermoprotei archaeon]
MSELGEGKNPASDDVSFKETYGDRILRFLMRYKNFWFSEDEISKALGIEREKVGQICWNLAHLDRIQRTVMGGKICYSFSDEKEEHFGWKEYSN